MLGPLRWLGPRGEVALGGVRPRRLLAALALSANEIVPAGRLVEAVWGESAPRSATENLRTYVWSLRRSQRAAGSGEPDAGDGTVGIEARPPGYRLRLPPQELDWLRFTGLVASAGPLLDRDPAAATRLLRQALGFWRGPVLAGLLDDADVLAPRVAAMEEARLAALEQRIQADLVLGRHHELAGELLELVSAHPLREQFRAAQMLALYRSGRQADAIAAYHVLRAELREELGVDPAPGTCRLYEAILRAEPRLQWRTRGLAGGAGGPAVPRQLPRRVAGFAGRRQPLSELDGLLAGDAGVSLIAVITGPPGVGKTSLALEWAHRIQDRFAAGTFFADLRGVGPAAAPAGAAGVLEGFLRAMDLRPGDIPDSVDARAALWRTRLDGANALIVLDNAASPAQVRPLLPGSPGSAVLVTSRSRLSGLLARDAARQIALPPLGDEEALALLRQVVDSRRVTAEPAAAREVSRLCGGLPLALRIAADQAASKPALTLAQVAGRLADEHDRLRMLTTDDEDTAVRAAFSWSYRALNMAPARMFRLVGLHPGPEFSAPAAASVAAVTVPRARGLLVTLAQAHLVEQTADDRFRLHDLLRLYAAERAGADEPEAVHRAASRRLLTWYLRTADRADRLLIPGRPRPASPPPASGPGGGELAFGSYEEAYAWCESERANLVAATRQAAAQGEDLIACQLPAVLGSYLKLSRRWADWIAMSETGLAAARRAGQRDTEAWLLSSLGAANGDVRRFGDADRYLRQALVIRQDIGDLAGAGAVLVNLGFLARKVADSEASAAYFERALAIFEETSEPYGQAMALNNLGEAYRELGRQAEALSHLQRALALFRDTGDRYNQAMVLDSLAGVKIAAGRPEEALVLLAEALELRLAGGDQQGEAVTRGHIADCYLAQGDQDRARPYLRQALAILEELGDPEAQDLRHRLDQLGR